MRLQRSRLLVSALLGCICLARPAIAQQATGAIEAVVRDAEGRGLPEVDVRVGGRSVRTGGDGTFRMDGLAAGEHPIDLRRIGYAPLRARILIIPDAVIEMEFVLIAAPAILPSVAVEARRSGIFGLVGDTAYRALVDARVQVLGSRGGTVHTDSTGRFAFPRVLRGAYLVRVSKPGYASRQMLIELDRGEGRDMAVLLTPTGRLASRAEEIAARDLGRRLSWTPRRKRLTADGLSIYGSAPLCDVGLIRMEIGDETTVIVNGTTILRDYPLSALCSWRADDVDLVEFGRDACSEATQTIAWMLRLWCGPRPGMRGPSSIDPGGSSGAPVNRSYVVVWEKR